MQEQMGKVTRKMKILRVKKKTKGNKKRFKKWKQKHKISHHFPEMKNIIDAFTTRLDTADKNLWVRSILTESLKIDSKRIETENKPKSRTVGQPQKE